MEKTNHKTLPMIWGSFDVADLNLTYFYDVEFIEDFGAIKKGSKFDDVLEDNQTGYLIACNVGADGKAQEEIRQRIKYVVVEE